MLTHSLLSIAVRDKLQRANLVADPSASPTTSRPISDVGFTGVSEPSCFSSFRQQQTMGYLPAEMRIIYGVCSMGHITTNGTAHMTGLEAILEATLDGLAAYQAIVHS